ncbi:MAG: hypothetical protein AAGA54_12140 [Myxococcota bacterium]
MRTGPARLPIERLAEEEGFAFYSWGSLFLSFNGVQASDAYFDAFDSSLKLHMRRNPESVFMYSIHRIDRVTSQPSAESRKKSADLLKLVDPILHGNVMVFDVRGMTGAIIRTFVSGVFLLTRSKVRNKVCDDPVEGAQWLRDLEPPVVPDLAENYEAFLRTALTEADRIMGPSPRTR